MRDSDSADVLPTQSRHDLELLLVDPDAPKSGMRRGRRHSTMRASTLVERGSLLDEEAIREARRFNGTDVTNMDDEASEAGLDEEIVQVVPPVAEGTWPAVTRFATAALAAGATVEESVDEADRGLPDELKSFQPPPKMVRCIATPIVRVAGSPSEAQGVLSVWGAESYGPSDHAVLRMLIEPDEPDS